MASVERPDKKVQYCVKVQIWSNGFLKKTISKEFFSTLKEAEIIYNGHEEEGTRVMLSKYTDGNERAIKWKWN